MKPFVKFEKAGKLKQSVKHINWFKRNNMQKKSYYSC